MHKSEKNTKIQIVRIWSAATFGKCAITALNNTHNDPKESEGASENFYDENLDEWIRILCISDGASTARNSYTNTELDALVTRKIS